VTKGGRANVDTGICKTIIFAALVIANLVFVIVTRIEAGQQALTVQKIAEGEGLNADVVRSMFEDAKSSEHVYEPQCFCTGASLPTIGSSSNFRLPNWANYTVEAQNAINPTIYYRLLPLIYDSVTQPYLNDKLILGKRPFNSTPDDVLRAVFARAVFLFGIQSYMADAGENFAV